MGMRVYYSERIEDLALKLKLRLVAERSEADAFAVSQVVVPNANIAKWLRICAFADAPSLCAGIEFPFIEQALFRAMNESLGEESRAELLPMNAYANGIMAILQGERNAALEPFYGYIGSVGASQSRKAWQLCVKLADLMDQYEVRRPDIVRSWLSGKGINGGAYADETEAAEAEVARRLFGAGGIYPPGGARLSLRQLFERALGASSRAKGGTYRFFGLSTLTPLQVGILRWLAKDADVEVYHNNVCLEYWGDIEPRARCRNVQSDDDFEIENPLLREWGVAGRETMRLLASLEEEADADVAFEWLDVSQKRSEPANVLEAVQRGICRRRGRADAMAQDSSLQVVAAPGIRREIEMVHNAIVGLMLRGDCGDFSDVGVLVTDMRRYRPLIEAVFDGRGVIPYGLIDTSVSGESDCLAAFLALMELARKGMSRTTLFAVLENPCVQRALGFGADEVRSWRAMAEEAGAFEGFGEDGEFANFTWSAGLSRIRLGFVADDSPSCAVCQCADESALKFSEVAERLYREISPLGKLMKTCAQWARMLRDAIEEFIDTGDDAREESVRRAICETLGALRDIPGEHAMDFASAAVEELVGGMKSSRSGYLTRGVTIASLQPMRPVPFRNVFVIGMGEGDFPGRESATTLDMRGTKRGLGDASLPVQNRYLFLETLMAARDRLVISYPSLDTQKDAELFPSGLVCDLEKFVADAMLPQGETFREIPLPLLERGEQGDCPLVNPVGEIDWNGYWAGIIPTYSEDVRRLAARLANGERRRGVCGCGCEEKRDVQEAVTAAELAAFIIDPLQGILRNRFGVPADRDAAEADDIPLELPDNGPVKWRFDEAVMKASGESHRLDEAGLAEDIARTYDCFAEHGEVPQRGSFLGAYSLRRIAGEYAGGGFLSVARRFADGLKGGEGVSCALVVKNSEDESKKKLAAWPPRATIAPFVAWLMATAEKDDDAPRTLAVGIVDFRHGVCAKWQWSGVTPHDAKAALAALKRRYKLFVGSVAEDGRYLKTGYSLVTNAMCSLKMSALPSDGDENGWRDIAEAIEEPFNAAPPNLAISATKGALERLPRADDWMRLRDFCRDVFPMILTGRRVAQ